MGGIGSGNHYRWNTKPILDDCRSIDINAMVRLGAIREGYSGTGHWRWVSADTGEETSKIGYECNTIDKSNSYLRLIYKMTSTQEKIDYKIPLVRTYPPYGGVRFWFICPKTGKRVGKLYIVSGSNYFLSRHVYRIHYASQTHDKITRSIDKKWKLMNKVDGEYFPIRPKGMHSKTFDRIFCQFIALEDICDNMLVTRFGDFIP